MTKRSFSGLLAAALLLLIAGLMMRAERQEARVEPGRDEEGAVTLHNGWRLAPAGRHVTVGNLPLALIESPDARHLIVTNDGYGKPTLSVIDVASWSVKEHFPLEHAWLGLAWHPDGTRLFSSGASQNAVQELKYENGSLAPLRVIQLPPAKNAFVGGLAPHPDGTRLFVVRVLPQDLVVIDLTRGEVEKTLPLAAEPYTSVVSADGKKLYVSVWGGAKVLEIDSATATVAREIAVGEHPNAMMLTRDGRLFVACANTNAVWAVDLAAGRSREQISVALYPDAPAGSTPNSLAGSPDGRTLLVANADNNTVAVVDISKRDRSRVTGFIPAGWYPTGAIFSRDGKQIFVISGKGLASAANPNGPLPTDPTRRRPRDQYTGSMFRGAVSLVPVPDAPALAAFTKNVYELTPYRDAARLRPAGAPASSPIPREVGGPSPITYVFYVIRENRTYDQVFGDIRSANGDPSLCLFGEDVTPNAHAIVRQFVLLDNFYVNAEVSYNGHPYSTAAYATDAVEKIWPLNYANRGGAGLDEGAGPLRNPYGGLAAPAQGYLWDLCKRHGISVRSYGEYVRSAERGKTEPPYVPRVPGLKGLINTNYPPFDLRIPDSRRVDVWMEEFREYEKTGGLPRLSIIQLGGDHTNYTAPGFQLPAPTWPKTTSRLAGWSKPSAPAVSGSNPQSSWSKTTRRAGRTTWTRIDRSG